MKPHVEQRAEMIDIGVEEPHLNNVSSYQRAFTEAFGKGALAQLG